jgi:CO dehydrogenase/acetyl-CoA synthase gamma subunit (corrinoid Fe-S protein)
MRTTNIDEDDPILNNNDTALVYYCFSLAYSTSYGKSWYSVVGTDRRSIDDSLFVAANHHPLSRLLG